LLKRAATIFDELKQSARDIEFLADPTAGLVRIGCAESFMAGLLPAIIQKLARKHPKIVVHAEYAQPETTEFRELRERRVDLTIGRTSEPFAPDDLELEPLYEEKYHVVASASSPWARRRKLGLAELAGEPWIHMPSDSVVRVILEQAFRQNGLDVPQERVASLSMHLRCHLVANARFVTIMPNSMFRFNADRWGLKALPIDLAIRPRKVAIITVKHRTLSPVVRLFLEQAHAVAKTRLR
jgi:DNA-binding transcriptional LysR family regulator